MVRYFYGRKLVFAAWGRKAAEHCGAHAVKNPKGGWYQATPGCPVAIPKKDVGGNIVGFLLKSPKGTLVFK
jgi:hypothetical protein